MYGQKASFGAVSTGITVTSWWMRSVTVLLAAAAVVLLVRACLALRSNNPNRRP